MPVICWKTKNTDTTSRARREAGAVGLDAPDGVRRPAHLLDADLRAERGKGRAHVLVALVTQQPARRFRHLRPQHEPGEGGQGAPNASAPRQAGRQRRARQGAKYSPHA
jgi:hypothetical protein